MGIITRVVAFAGFALLGCAAGDECRFGTDCPSGSCSPEGVCLGVDDAGVRGDGGLVDAALGSDAAATPDAALDLDAAIDAGVTDAGPPACHDGDGRLSAAELPLPLDVALTRRIATGASVDTSGTERPDGTRVWDFEGPFAGDVDRSLRRTSPSGAWYASSFPSASYVLPLGADEDLLGVFELDADALVLLGVVSVDEGIARTELTYDPPAPVWRFPLEVGASWDVTSAVSGVSAGVPSAYSERWRVEVDAEGRVGTPDGVREVLRVNTRITRTVGALVSELRRHSYVEPCVGTVAQVFADGADAEPSSATELWRVAP